MDAELGQLDAIVDGLRRIDACGVAIATTALPEVLAAAKETAAAGVTPDGVAWRPTKADGRRALPQAASAITAVVSGTTKAVITLVLSGVYVYHQAKGKGQRRILFDPTQGVPQRMTDAIARAAARVVPSLMGAR